MSDFLERVSKLSPKRLAFLASELNANLEALKQRHAEPLAIIGLGCRFPGGGSSPDAYWQLLVEGRNGVSEVPAERWDIETLYDPDPDAPGKMNTRWAGFLENIDLFDPDFFGISPREAPGMDPQQRLLLEVVWEALEHAGQSPDRLAGTRTGMFAGVCNGDYWQMNYAAGAEAMDAYVATGNAHSVVSGRISYLLGLQGPSLSVDTACSSSLVAVHLACQSLRADECRMAIAAGVNLILTPEPTITLSKARMMSPEGRCKAFDASADGFVRAEGCGAVVLKRLSQARADGDRVLAVIRGSACNQDGRSGGLTAPNGPSQVAVIREALKNAGLSPAEIDLLEAHGTGTSLGDPIEAGALAEVFAANRMQNRPLWVGSSKSNFGHAEAAAGIGGLIKAILALQHEAIPPSLHLRSLSPHIDWDPQAMRVATTVVPWPRDGAVRAAGVSSFGFSGTNAHVVLGDPPDTREADRHGAAEVVPDAWLLPVSARSEAALAELVASYRCFLEAGDRGLSASDICRTAAVGRSHFEHRLVIRGSDLDALRLGLSRVSEGALRGAVQRGCCNLSASPGVVLLFTGQGSQYPGMARRLFDSQPLFRHELHRCEEILEPLLDRPLTEILFAPHADDASQHDGLPLLHGTEYAQPAIFAVEYALAALWRSWGVEPVAVLGHSVGEYVAACVAGVFGLEDGLRLISERGRLMAEMQPGAMAAVFTGGDRVQAALDRGGGCEIACFNGPDNVVISGDEPAVDELLRRFTAEGIGSRRLAVSRAFHSALMEPMLDRFQQVAEGITFREPRVAIISNLTGAPATKGLLTSAAYWRRHVREPVRFHQSVQGLLDSGQRLFLEIGPQPVLSGMARGLDTEGEAVWLSSLCRDGEDWSSLLEAVAGLYVNGFNPDWGALYRHCGGRIVSLPNYPFERRRFWLADVDHRQRIRKHAPLFESAWSAGRRQSAYVPIGVDLDAYPGRWEALERFTVAHVAETLRAMGAFTKPGESRDADSLIHDLGIPALYRHLMQKWLERLARDGVLRREGDTFMVDAPLPPQDLGARLRESEQIMGDDPALMAFIRHCASKLREVVAGRESPLEMLFPEGSYDLSEALYESANMNRYANAVAGAVLEAAARQGRPQRPYRVLEVGAGTGGTSATLLPLLDPETTSYVFSDVSDVFLNHARRKFADYGFARYIEFDLDRELETQGLVAGSFDAIVGANVMHAARDLEGAIGRLAKLLAPGGLLLLVEVTEQHAWLEISAGLVEGWQHFADGLRGDNPLLPASRWQDALTAHGFVEARVLPEAGSPAGVFGQHVIMARTAAADGQQQPSQALAPALHAVEAATEVSGGVAAVASPDVIRERRTALEVAASEEQLELLVDYVREQVMAVLRLDPDRRPDRRHRLMDLGLDSLMAVQLRNRLERGLAIERTLPATLMFDYPTIEAIAGFLQARLFAGETPEASQINGRDAERLRRSMEIDELTDEEAEAELLRRIEGGQED
ncbi:acyltransferase domain-containing protein [Methylonatrum kenyense]|uniref:type I polyketide synthase n=1 Tax=Methylonatrum kenyense TaxID=455253 RepID=UPI0020C0229D|nr:type I polyketide synthase [Methylonatrum kenyense]MCK8516801.1 acyltransferase domain-containing protein [Methylonatrum kenyense]